MPIMTDSPNLEKLQKSREVAEQIADYMARGFRIRKIPMGVSTMNIHKFSLFACAGCNGSENRHGATAFCEKCWAKLDQKQRKEGKKTRKAKCNV